MDPRAASDGASHSRGPRVPVSVWSAAWPSERAVRGVAALMQPSFAGPLSGSARVGARTWLARQAPADVVAAYLGSAAPIPAAASAHAIAADIVLIEGRFARTGIFVSAHPDGSVYTLAREPTVVIEGESAPSGEAFAQVAASSWGAISEITLQGRTWTLRVGREDTEEDRGADSDEPDEREEGSERQTGEDFELIVVAGPLTEAMKPDRRVSRDPVFRGKVALVDDPDGRIIATTAPGSRIQRVELTPTVALLTFFKDRGLLEKRAECELTHRKGSHPSRPTLTARGYDADEMCEISFDESTVARVRASAEGELRRAINIPREAEVGRHTISVAGKKSGRRAETDFTVLPER